MRVRNTIFQFGNYDQGFHRLLSDIRGGARFLEGSIFPLETKFPPDGTAENFTFIGCEFKEKLEISFEFSSHLNFDRCTFHKGIEILNSEKKNCKCNFTNSFFGDQTNLSISSTNPDYNSTLSIGLHSSQKNLSIVKFDNWGGLEIIVNHQTIKDFQIQNCILGSEFKLNGINVTNWILSSNTYLARIRYSSTNSVIMNNETINDGVEILVVGRRVECSSLYLKSGAELNLAESFNASIMDLKIDENGSISIPRGTIKITDSKNFGKKSKLSLAGLQKAEQIELTNSTFGSLSIFTTNNAKQDSISNIRLEKVVVTQDFDISGVVRNSLTCINSKFYRSEFTELECLGALEFIDTSFENAPRFFQESIPVNTDFLNCKFINRNKLQINAFRQLKIHMASGKHSALEDDFHAFELDSYWRYRRWTKETWLEKLIAVLHRVTNNYGRSIQIPFWTYLIVSGIFILFYITYPSATGIHMNVTADMSVLDWRDRMKIDSETSQAIWYGVFNMFGPLKLLPALQVISAGDRVVLVISFIQSLFSSFMLYLMISWVRRRFRN